MVCRRLSQVRFWKLHYDLQYVLCVQACLNSHKIGRDILDDPI